MTLLMTGAEGFIGGHLMRRLRERGAEVIGIGRSEIDLTDADACSRWADEHRPATIVHLAARLPRGDDERGCLQENTASTHNALGMLPPGGHFVFASGDLVYGTSASDEPVDETQPLDPQSQYAMSKVIGELACRRWARDGNPCTILRIVAPYGPGATRPTVVSRFLEAAASSKALSVWGTGSRTQQFTFIDDVVDAILAAVDRRVTGTFNIAGPKPVSMRELAELCVAAVPGSTSSIRIGERPDPQEDHRASISIDAAERELGWAPATPMEAGLRGMLERSATPV